MIHFNDNSIIDGKETNCIFKIQPLVDVLKHNFHSTVLLETFEKMNILFFTMTIFHRQNLQCTWSKKVFGQFQLLIVNAAASVLYRLRRNVTSFHEELSLRLETKKTVGNYNLDR